MGMTQSPKKGEIETDTFVVDADGQITGRLATRIAHVLMGKHKPQYVPFLDIGDRVIVVNAEKIRFTGNKEEDKLYHRHTGWVGGLKSQTVAEVRERYPERILMSAVKGMLPRGTRGRAMFSKLRVYAGPEHPHQGQQPKPLEV